jgi:DNA-binding XRE family transcriptional regulator
MYRVLRGLMAKHDLTVGKLSDIAGVSEAAMSKKLNGKHGFTLIEAKTIQDYFASYGDKLSIEDIFFTIVSSRVDEEV